MALLSVPFSRCRWTCDAHTSGKSTQKAFMFMPYRKLAKLSLNRLRLSCMSCKCIRFASRSAIESDSSANAGSSDSRGKAEMPDLGVNVWLSRNEVREVGRRGVEGREGGLIRDAEVERFVVDWSIEQNNTEQEGYELSCMGLLLHR